MNFAISAGRYVQIDQADLEEVSQHRWTFIPSSNGKRGYAARWTRRNGTRQTIYMHRQLMRAPDGVEVDHKNGDGLDNRRENLRLATSNQNNANRIIARPFRGVYRKQGRRRWTAQAKVDKKAIHIGSFATPEEAARAYDAFALKTWGEFARLNYKEETE